MKLTTKVAARMASAGYPDKTIEIESIDVKSLTLEIAKFLTSVYMNSKITITLAHDLASLTPKPALHQDMQDELNALFAGMETSDLSES